MAQYFGVIGNRDYIKLEGKKRPFWEFLDMQPDGWLTSLVYLREDLPKDKRMIFDCGAWSYRNDDVPVFRGQLVTPEWAFEQYRGKARKGDFLIAPDHMLIPGVNLDARRDFNRNSAQRFLEIMRGSSFVPMATVHGMDLTERIETAKRYTEMEYTALALGGLAARASQKAVVLDSVLAIRRAVPKVWLHILGLSSPDYTAAWSEFGIESFDGSSHFKQAFTAGTFYMEQGGKLVKYKAARTERGKPNEVIEPVTAPLCKCKACHLLRQDGVDTRTYGSNENNMGRAAHNMNMLMRAQKAAINGMTVLVSCVGKKLDAPSLAADLYQSDWFLKARVYAEMTGDRWYILSAKHGLLDPEKEIEPYNLTLNTMSVDERKEWAELVLNQIKRQIPRGKLIILAGRRYREFLTEELENAGFSVEVPMEGLGIGQQLAWLNEKISVQLRLF